MSNNSKNEIRKNETEFLENLIQKLHGLEFIPPGPFGPGPYYEPRPELCAPDHPWLDHVDPQRSRAVSPPGQVPKASVPPG